MKDKKVKGVVLAAGYGSRFLPASKTVPKELFPLVDRPAIDFIISEMVNAGIEDILVITSRRKKALEDYLDREIELENAFQDKPDKLQKILPPKANIHFIRQQQMRGTGDALSLCRAFAGDNAFVVAYPDDLVFGKIPLAKQLINIYQQTGKNVLACQNLPDEDVSRYGVIEPAHEMDHSITCFVKSLVEKPLPGTEPSKLISLGRYLFTPEIFPIIDQLIDQPREGEFYQTEIINILAQQGKVLALDFEGTRYDTGEPIGYLKALIDYAMRDKDISKLLKGHIQAAINSENYTIKSHQQLSTSTVTAAV